MSGPSAMLFCQVSSSCRVSIWLAPDGALLVKLPSLSSERAYCRVLRQAALNWPVAWTAAVFRSCSLWTS